MLSFNTVFLFARTADSFIFKSYNHTS